MGRTGARNYSVGMPKSKVRKKAKAKKQARSVPTPEVQAKTKGPSPTWYVALMFGLMGVGLVVILLNYMGVLPGDANNRNLIIGLGGIAVGFGMTLGWH